MKENIIEIKEFFKNNKKAFNVIILILLLLIPLAVSIGIRSQTAQLRLIDNQAEQNVMNFYRQQIAQDVENNYAYLPQARRNEMINENLAVFIRENSNRIQREIKEVSEMMKEGFRDDEGTPYMTDIDTWHFYRIANNYIQTGTPGDTIIDGVAYETLRNGRFKREQRFDFHPWMMAQTHKIWTLFDRNVPPMKSTSYFVMIFATLALIPAFFIGRRLTNNFGAFVTAMFLAVHPVIMTRTVSNFADDDVHHLFFTLVAIWMVIEAYRSKDHLKQIIFSSMAGLSIAIHSIIWTGWWYGSLFIFSGLLIFVLVKLFKEFISKNNLKKSFLNSKHSITMFGTYFLSTFLFSIILNSSIRNFSFNDAINKALETFTGPFHFLFQRFDVGTVSVWPNVMVTVAELRHEPLNTVIRQVGSPLIIFIAFVGLAMLFLNKELNQNDKIIFWSSVVYYAILTAMLSNMVNVYLFVILTALPVAFVAIYSIIYKSNLKVKHSILFGIFLTGTIFSSTMGIRFMFLAIPIISILIGVTLGKTYDKISDYLFKNLSINKTLARSVLVVLMLWLVLPGVVESGYNTATRMMPMYNDAWDDTLKIVKESSDDAIITSWWDFGYFFMVGAERRVTFDGGNQGRRIHWVGKSLLTSNETEAISILRMLNCGQERPTEILEQYFTEYEAVKILYELVEVNDKEKAEDILRREGLSNENISELMQYTYCDDLIDNYFIASSDMIGKSGVWAHFGIWDFDRAFLYNRVRNSNMRDALQFLVEEYNYTETEARGTYNEIMSTPGDQWISPWPSYMSNIANCRQNNQTIECENGVVINENMEAFVITEQGLAKVSQFSYIEDDEFKFVEQENADIEVGVALFPSGNVNQSIIMHEALTASMFTRMFFFEGFGLENFEFINYERGMDGIEIYLYKVKWDE